MHLKLFDRKRQSITSHLAEDEKITAISGYGCTIVVGTNQGRLHIFNTASPKWEEETNLALLEDSDCRKNIAQICCASACCIILTILENKLFVVGYDDALSVYDLLSGIKRIALNCYPTTDDPFSLEVAATFSQKREILIGRISSQDDAIQFNKRRVLPVEGRAVEICYNGNYVCYATEDGTYYVQSVNESGCVKLFNCDTTLRVIRPMGIEEFLLSGVQGLLIFVNSQGASPRPPITIEGLSMVAGLELKEPFYYSLDNAGKLYVFNTMDGQVKQTLEFPNDEEDVVENNRGNYHLANIDGQIFVLPPCGKNLYELVSISLSYQIEELINQRQLDQAMAMFERDWVELCGPADETDFLKIRQLQQNLAFLFLKNGEFEKCFDLLVKSEADPQPLLERFVKRNEKLNLNREEEIGSEHITDEQLPEIPMEIFKNYLEKIHKENWFAHNEQLESVLARLYIILGDFNSSGNLNPIDTWNDQHFREWLEQYQNQPNLAAKLAVDANCFEEAFIIWHKMAENKEVRCDDLIDCFQTLPKLKSSQLLLNAFHWLIPINANLCMEAIVQIEQTDPEIALPIESIIDLFKAAEERRALFVYLEKRIYKFVSEVVHNEMLEMFIHFIANNKFDDPQIANKEVLLQKFRYFLLFSEHYDRELAIRHLAKWHNLFEIETILVKADDDSSVNCLLELTDKIGNSEVSTDDLLSSAELLCERFPSVKMLKEMIKVYLKFSKVIPSLQAHIPRILSLLENDDACAKEVFSNMPEDLSASPVIQTFLRRHIAHQLNANKWQNVYENFAQKERRKLVIELSRQTSLKFLVDEETRCMHCERPITMSEEFVRMPQIGQIAHLRCHRVKKEWS